MQSRGHQTDRQSERALPGLKRRNPFPIQRLNIGTEEPPSFNGNLHQVQLSGGPAYAFGYDLEGQRTSSIVKDSAGQIRYNKFRKYKSCP